MSASAPQSKLPVVVEKPTPYTFDLGLLLANDSNPLEVDRSQVEASLAATARDGAQALINQLLTTCPVHADKAGVLLDLPPVTTPLPRSKPVPAAKAETKWQAFARKRGIKPKTREARRNLQYDADKSEWVRKWGYKGANKAGQDEPVVELDMRQEAKRAEGTTVRGDKRREIRERVKRNERLMRRNQKRAEGR